MEQTNSLEHKNIMKLFFSYKTDSEIVLVL